MIEISYEGFDQKEIIYCQEYEIRDDWVVIHDGDTFKIPDDRIIKIRE